MARYDPSFTHFQADSNGFINPCHPLTCTFTFIQLAGAFIQSDKQSNPIMHEGCSTPQLLINTSMDITFSRWPF